MDNNLITSHIGNLAQTGKDFNVIVTNAPFKLLSSLDNKSSDKESIIKE